MKCTCPKCSAEIELPLTEVPEEGTSTSCPACKGNFSVHRESFGGRAARKSGEISCSACGEILGPQLHCRNCGVPFPDLVVFGQSRMGARKKAAVVKLKSSPFKKQKPMMELPSLEMAMKDGAQAPKRPQAARRRIPARTVALVSVLLLIIAAVVGSSIYLKKKKESEYAKNFVLVAYGIQVGTDRCDRACQKLAAEWKTRTDAGQAFTPRLNIEDEKELSRINDKLDSVKASLPPEPEKFGNSRDKLARLEGSYNKIRSVATSPGNSLAAFNDSVNKADADYKAAANEFKSGLPPELMDELKAGSLRFRGLRPLVK
jgi:hypothetical protein